VESTSVAVTGITELLLLQHQIVSQLDKIYEAFPSKVAGAWLVLSEDGFRRYVDERRRYIDERGINSASRVAQSSAEAPSSTSAGGNLLAPPASPGEFEWELV